MNTRDQLMTLNHQVEMVLNGAITRSSLMGTSAALEREQQIDNAAGYPQAVNVDDYWRMWKRLGIARRIIRAYPRACWQKHPLVYEVENTEITTVFETVFDELNNRTSLLASLANADVLCGIGRFGVLLVGFADGKSLELPLEGFDENLFQRNPGTNATPKMNVNFVRPFSEKFVKVVSEETNVNSPRFGQPTMYAISMSTGSTTNSLGLVSAADVQVHWHRVIHLTDETDESLTYSTPRLESVYNDLLDFKKVSAGSPEMYWQGGLPGLTFKLDAGFDSLDEESIRTQMEEYARGLRRYVSAVGCTVNTLAPTVVDPTPHFNIKVQAISAATEIPQRILLGTEEGRLAGDQDGESWDERVLERQTNHCTPHIVIKVCNHFQRAQVLPATPDGVKVNWADRSVVNDKERADVALKLTQALALYLTSGLENVYPFADYLHMILKMSLDEVDALIANLPTQAQDDSETPQDVVKPADEKVVA